MLADTDSVLELRRGFGGVIPNNSSVLADYNASASNAADFRTFGDQVSVRLDLLDGLVGVYSRYGRQRYSGDGAPLDQEYNDAVLGMDINARWFRGGAEHEVYDAVQAPYTATRLYETAIFEPTDGSTINFDFRQTRTRFPEEDQEESLYQFIGRYQVRVTSALSLSAEGGKQYGRDQGGDRDVTTVRAGADFALGLFSLSASYDLQDETYRGEKRDRQSVHLTARRSFR